MNATDADGELQRLLSELLDGSLSEEDRLLLNDRLRDEPQARALYLDLCEAHAALAWEHGLVVAPVDPPPTRGAWATVRGRRALIGVVLGTVLSAAVILIAVAFWPAVNSVGPTVAMVTDRIDAVGMVGAAEWAGNVSLGGEYELERGLVRFEYPSGVSVLIESLDLWTFAVCRAVEKRCTPCG